MEDERIQEQIRGMDEEFNNKWVKWRKESLESDHDEGEDERIQEQIRGMDERIQQQMGQMEERILGKLSRFCVDMFYLFKQSN